jgi:hypothetical protein
VARHFQSEDPVKQISVVRSPNESRLSQGETIVHLRVCMSDCPDSISMYIDHKSQRLGCESTIPSNIVLPRSGSPYLYSNWANFEIVFKSKADR